MPATAGRVRMPANNRVHSSAALQTHGIWQSAIGYDPYAPNKEDEKKDLKSSNVEPEGENAYASFQGLLALARITGSSNNDVRGACKRCGRVGHLPFQCRNFINIKDDGKGKDPEAIQADVMSELDKLKGNSRKVVGKGGVESSDESEEDDESESSDSEYDSEIERVIAERSGKRVDRKKRTLRKRQEDSDNDGVDSDKIKRGRSKKRSHKRRSEGESDSSDGRKKRRREKLRKRDESSDEEGDDRRRHRKSRKEKRRRRSHCHSDDSESEASEDSDRSRRRRRRREAMYESGGSDADDSRAIRGRKRSEKKSRRHHNKDD